MVDTLGVEELLDTGTDYHEMAVPSASKDGNIPIQVDGQCRAWPLQSSKRMAR